MANERVEDIISKEALDSVDSLTEKVNNATKSFELFIEKAIEANKAVGGSSTLKEYTEATKNLNDSQKDLDKSAKQLADTQAKLAASQTDNAKELAKLQVQTQEQSKANKEAAREALGLNDAYKQLEKQAAAAEKSAKNLAASTTATAKEQQEAALKAKTLNDRLKDIDASVGKNQRNVGNYSESFSVLEKELTRVTTKINGLSTAQREAAGAMSGPRGAPDTGARAAADDTKQLVIQQQALQQVLNSSSRGFTSLTQELRSSERSLQSLRNAGLAETEAFKVLQTQTNSTRKSFNDFAKSQKILSSDLPALTGLTVAAKGLAGAYALGAGAAALFGDEEGKIDKEVQKLVAIMTVLQGLQEAHELIQQKDAIATALAAAAQKAYAFVVGESVGALAAFRVALAATGIGLFIVTIAYLVENWKDLFGAIDPVIDLLDKSTNVSRSAKESLKSYGDTSEKISNGIIKKLQDNVKALNDELKKTPDTAEDAALHLQQLQKRITQLNTESEKLKKNGTGFDEADAITIGENAAEVENLSKQVRNLNIQLSITGQVQAFRERNDFNKARSEALVQSLKDQQDANTRLAADQAATYKTKQKALEDNYFLERIIINRAYEAESNDADGNASKQLAADTKYKSSLLKADRDFHDQRLANQREFAKRDADAAAGLLQTSENARIEFNKKNADDEALDFSTRLIALRNFEDASLKIIDSKEKQELAVLGLTPKEKLNIEHRYQAERDKLIEDASKQRLAILVANARQEGSLFKQVYDDIYNYIQARSKKFQDITVKNQAEFLKLVTEGIKSANANIKREFDGLENAVSKLFTREDGQSVDDYNKEIKELTKSLEEIGTTAFNGAAAAVDSKFDRQKKALEDQLNLIDQRTQKEIEGVNQSSDSEQKKAARIAALTAKGEAQKRINEQKQRDIDLKKARFDKAVTIANIIAQTALAVVKALPVIPLAIAAGVLGAVQLAIAASAPLPTYAEGIDSHPGGPAIVGDGGKSELIVTPTGKLMRTPNVPSLIDLEKGATVFPDANQALAEYYGGMTVQKYNELNNTGVEDKLDKVVKAIKNIPRDQIVHRKYGWDIMKENSIHLKSNWR